MTSHVFHYCASFEDTAVNEETINFPRHSSEITVTNDDNNNDLCFKFCVNENYMTVHKGETVTVRMNVMSMMINAMGNNVPYRIWVFT